MKTKVALQNALDSMAANLTTVCQNVAADNIADEARSPQSVLRNVHKLFDISSTGEVTLDTVKFNQLFPADNAINTFPFGSGTLASKQL
jgi:hypothetical protein